MYFKMATHYNKWVRSLDDYIILFKELIKFSVVTISIWGMIHVMCDLPSNLLNTDTAFWFSRAAQWNALSVVCRVLMQVGGRRSCWGCCTSTLSDLQQNAPDHPRGSAKSTGRGWKDVETLHVTCYRKTGCSAESHRWFRPEPFHD